MATFTMTGLGSGFDIDKIVKAYIDAEQVPKETILDNKKVRLESELSAFGTLKSRVDQLDSALYDLNKLELQSKNWLPWRRIGWNNRPSRSAIG